MVVSVVDASALCRVRRPCSLARRPLYNHPVEVRDPIEVRESDPVEVSDPIDLVQQVLALQQQRGGDFEVGALDGEGVVLAVLLLPPVDELVGPVPCGGDVGRAEWAAV